MLLSAALLMMMAPLPLMWMIPWWEAVVPSVNWRLMVMVIPPSDAVVVAGIPGGGSRTLLVPLPGDLLVLLADDVVEELFLEILGDLGYCVGVVGAEPDGVDL